LLFPPLCPVRASYRFLESFTAQIRNPHTRRAYARVATEFLDWPAAKGATQLAAIESVQFAAYIEQLQHARSGNAYAMIHRRAKSADITTKSGNQTFRATGVSAHLKNSGTPEKAAQMENHASARTTQLYDRRTEEVTLDEVKRILV
jgi:hypothetical protein